jgi:hypothetical protein
MKRNDVKELVLARRARFIAAAVASVGIACGKESREPPMPCLSVAYIPPDAEPMPCLSVAVDTPDAAEDAGPTDAGKPDADAGKTPAKVKPPPTTVPMPCLSPLPPKR